jgi:hypothetical protein
VENKNSADITSSIDKSYDSTNAVVTTPVDTSVVAIGTEAVQTSSDKTIETATDSSNKHCK